MADSPRGLTPARYRSGHAYTGASRIYRKAFCIFLLVILVLDIEVLNQIPHQLRLEILLLVVYQLLSVRIFLIYLVYYLTLFILLKSCYYIKWKSSLRDLFRCTPDYISNAICNIFRSTWKVIYFTVVNNSEVCHFLFEYWAISKPT